jgi:hypothetical protein
LISKNSMKIIAERFGSSLFIFIILLTILIIPAWKTHAASEKVSGTWTGTYVCNGSQANLVLEIDGDKGLFIFSYPDGSAGRYTLSIGYRPKSRSIKATPLEAVQMPPGYYMVGFSGAVSKNGDTISGRIQRCGDFRVTRGSVAPGEALAASPAAPKDSPQARADRRARPDGDLPRGAFEDGDANCQTGRMAVRVEFTAPDKDGYNATVSLRRKRFASFTQFRARADVGNRKIIVEAETKTDGPYANIAFDLVLNAGNRANGPFKAVSEELQCYGIYLRPTENAAPGKQSPSVPPQYQSYVGNYDGAIYQGEFMGVILQNVNQRVTAITPLSLEITPSQAGVADRIFDVDLVLQGKRYQYALMRDTSIARDGLALIPADTEEPYPRKGPVPYTTAAAGSVDVLPKGELIAFPEGGPADWTARGRLQYSTVSPGGSIALRRRTANQKSALASLCENSVKPVVAAMGSARNVARDLKIDFYPALNGLDTGRAAMIEAALSDRSVADAREFDIARLAFECSLTGNQVFAASDGTLSQDLFAPDMMSNALYELISWYSKAGVTVAYPPAKTLSATLREDNARAEAALAEMVRTAGAMTSTADILATVETALPQIRDARPSALSDKLGPLLARTADLASGERTAQSEARRAAASQRMAGIRIPDEATTSRRAALLDAITSGTLPNLTADDKLFLSGMLSYSGKECGQPAADVRTKLLGLLLQGSQLLTGTDFNQEGSFGDALSRSLGRQASFADGAAFAQSLGCGSDYVSALYELLATGIWQSERPSMLVRSCALDRPPGQCECIQMVAKQAFPDIANSRYSRSVIEQTIKKAPGIALQFTTTCGIVEY